MRYILEKNVAYEDNTGKIFLAKNGRNSYTSNTQHINIGYFWVKEKLDNGNFTMEYFPTDGILADFFTKPLQGKLFERHIQFIMG